MKPQSEVEQALLAFDYPFDHPSYSFVFSDGDVLPVDAVPWAAEDRIAVVSYGANRSPTVLRRKFAASSGVVIPTLHAELRGFDIVYAAFISTLGPVPATVVPSPDAVAEVAVQFFTPQQLERLHESERVGVSYGFAELSGDNLSIDGAPVSSAFCYYSLYGVLLDEGEPIALAEAKCRGRRWRALSQREIQSLVRRRLGSEVDADQFVLETVFSDSIRKERIAQLSSDAFVYHPESVLHKE
jgi:hypothetical protein